MINRVLIRMKTVQLLYSYLLIEKPFMLESQPSSPTKEKRFAYSLYLDLIYLINRLSGQVMGKNKSFPLKDTRFVLKTENDDKLKALQHKYQGEKFPFESVEKNLAEAIKGSLLFKEFERNRDNGVTTDNFWENVLNSIILPNVDVTSIIQSLPGYSLSGVERMKILMGETFRNFYSTRDNIDDALKTLDLSMQKARDLYLRLLALPVELTRVRYNQLEQNRHKHLASTEDLNPNMRFVNNRLVEKIEKNQDFIENIDSRHISWMAEDPELLEILLKAVVESEEYSSYMSNPEDNLAADAEFWKDVMVDIILNNQDFLEYLENKSVFWNDDLEIMMSFVLKTFKRFENPQTEIEAVLPKYKDGEEGKDAKFGAELFQYVIRNKDLYKKYIEETLAKEKWEADRLAFMDVVITMTALAEIINYPEIPLTVSINEYIEIAKSYSSAKSGQFVHGLLASIIKKLQDDKILIK